ncbi:hypothetical protein [Streptomyces virginiae]|uniref:hypothetical protein n=1 Tax=Streptomyces virginiae TaxID=1961 RepID=UPI0022585D91|nr:hypothetical protein [Streptomyces virginiae]MCX5276341.1 hypothetical protein [Streptomyces virginiae]
MEQLDTSSLVARGVAGGVEFEEGLVEEVEVVRALGQDAGGSQQVAQERVPEVLFDFLWTVGLKV